LPLGTTLTKNLYNLSRKDLEQLAIRIEGFGKFLQAGPQMMSDNCAEGHLDIQMGD